MQVTTWGGEGTGRDGEGFSGHYGTGIEFVAIDAFGFPAEIPV